MIPRREHPGDRGGVGTMGAMCPESAPLADPVELAEFRALSKRVCNWGRWGPEDELGTLNLITAEATRGAAAEVRRGVMFSLGMELGSSGPQSASPIRSNPIHLMTVDGGDAESLASLDPPTGLGRAADYVALRAHDNLFRFNDDYIMMPLQAATQWDALAHVYYEGQLYNGVSAATVTSQGALRCGIDKVQGRGIVGRGVLIDVAGHRAAAGGDADDDGSAVSPEELDEVLARQGTRLVAGDIVVVRTGWMQRYLQASDSTVTSGLHWTCAGWLYDHSVAALAADNPGVEQLGTVLPGAYLPMHLLALRDMGLMFGEFWDLEALAADCREDGRYTFQLAAPPLKVVGGVGSPVNPIAIK
jgi:kynurenine formamidase